MGKKKRIKALRKIAETLPDVTYLDKEEHIVSGRELIAQGHTEEDGVKISEYAFYPQSMPVMMNVNHTRRLKKVHAKHGMNGIISYCNGVSKHVKENEA